MEDIKNRKTIIFDFDGVIADTEQGRFRLLAGILDKYGIELKKFYTTSDIAGSPTDVFLRNHFPSLKSKDIETIIKKRRGEFLSHLDEYCIVYPGAYETINDLKSKRYELVLATVNDSFMTSRLLKHIGIREAFSHIYTREKIHNPEMKSKDYSMLVEDLNLDKSKSVIIEDSLFGVTSATENNLFCIAFNRYSDPRIDEFADLVIEDYNDLRKVFSLDLLKASF